MMLLDMHKSRRSTQKLLERSCYKDHTKADEEYTRNDEVFSDFIASDANHNDDFDDEGYGTFNYDSQQQSRLRSDLQKQLSTAHTELGLEMYIPCNLFERTTQDILSMAQTEPYALKGCVIHVNLQRKNICHKLGKIVCDPQTVATFEVYLTFEESGKRWHGISDLLVTFVARCFNDKAVYINPRYRLVKHKLYRSNSLTSTSSNT